jgi:hypothetical protein
MKTQIRTIEVSEVTKVDEILTAFSQSETDLILIDEAAVVSEPHLELLTDYPRKSTTVLVARLVDGDIRTGGGRVKGASSAFHTAGGGNSTFAGVMRLSQNQREEVIETLKAVVKSNIKGHALDLILVALVRAGIVVASAKINFAPFVRSSDPEVRAKVRGEINSLNDGRLRLKMANRANDGFFSVFVLRKFSKLFTWAAVRTGLTPNQITLISFAIGLLSAYEFSRGDFWSIFIGAGLLQLSLIVDCVDGEIARYTRKFSGLGAWLDAITDRIKEYLVFFGLAYGAAKNGRDLWIPAMAMMLFQTFRHLSDYNFKRISKLRKAELPLIDFDLANDGYVRVERKKKTRLEYWGRKALQFPIGERWLAISASAIIGGATFTFTIMPILSLISITLVFRGRIRATRKWEKERVSKDLIDDQLDFFKNKKSTNRFDWIEPSILRAIEGIIIIWLTIIADLNRPTAFLLLFVIIFGHYDNLYRALQGERKPTWISVAGTYMIGRLVLLAIFVVFSWSITPLVWYFGVLFLAVSSAQWVAGEKSRNA